MTFKDKLKKQYYVIIGGVVGGLGLHFLAYAFSGFSRYDIWCDAVEGKADLFVLIGAVIGAILGKIYSQFNYKFNKEVEKEDKEKSIEDEKE